MTEAVLDQPEPHTDPVPESWTRTVGDYRRSAGPTLIVVGGVHGNEPTGLIAAQRVLDALNAQPPSKFTGRLVVLAGNLPALNEHCDDTRYIDIDLNRVCKPSTIAGRGSSVEHNQARQLIAAIDQIKSEAAAPVVLVDLHTVSAPSPPFVATPDALPIRTLADHLPIARILGFEEELPGLLADYASTHMGIPAMVYEAGQHKAASSVDCHEWCIWLLLDAASILPLGDRPSAVRAVNPRAQLAAAAGKWAGRVFDIHHRHNIDHGDFAVEPNIRPYARVSRHHPPIARQNGDVITSPVAGRVFMPNLQPLKRIDDDGFFIIQDVGRVWLRLSRWLRTRRLLHRMVPKIVPGVRIRNGNPDELLVAPEIAAVFRRQVFHLLGYRLVRHSPPPDLSPFGRMLLAARTLAGSLKRIGFGLLRGGEKGVLPVERPEDWIVARRPLDLTE